MHIDLDQPQQSDVQPVVRETFFSNDTDARIVASLVEKQMTTPDNYPLTLNSVCLACNQKSNREPVMNLASGEILRSLRVLTDKKLVMTSQSGRSEKFDQRLAKQLDVDRAGLSLLTVLILRGPQTLSELKTRTARMFTFDDLDDVELGLYDLIEKDSPLVKNLGKLNGQREERYVHLLRGDVNIDEIKMPTARKSSEVTELTVRVQELEQLVETLKAELSMAKAG